tara:strand:- start:347 stop:556 length:210 start_codon:yes stop_codon:yes gene_type:complete
MIETEAGEGTDKEGHDRSKKEGEDRKESGHGEVNGAGERQAWKSIRLSKSKEFAEVCGANFNLYFLFLS